MNLLKRSAGLVTILFAILGLLLCIAAMAGIWMGQSRLHTIVSAVFGTADEAFNFIETKTDRVSLVLGRSRQRASGLSKLAERLQATGLQEATDVRPSLEAIDELFRELQSAQDWLDSSEAVARGVSRVSESIAESQSERSDDESAGMRAKKLAAFSDSVADVIAKLQFIRQSLIDLRQDGIVAREFASLLLKRIADVDQRLADVSGRVGDFKIRLASARASSEGFGQSVRKWIFLVALILTLLLLWFGLSQVAMARVGRRFAQSRAKNKV